MLQGILFPAYCAFCCQDAGFDRNVKANYACIPFLLREKKVVLFLSLVSVLLYHIHTHTSYVWGGVFTNGA